MPGTSKQRMVEARQAAGGSRNIAEAGDGGRDEHADLERRQQEHRPGEQRPPAFVEGVGDGGELHHSKPEEQDRGEPETRQIAIGPRRRGVARSRPGPRRAPRPGRGSARPKGAKPLGTCLSRAPLEDCALRPRRRRRAPSSLRDLLPPARQFAHLVHRHHRQEEAREQQEARKRRRPSGAIEHRPVELARGRSTCRVLGSTVWPRVFQMIRMRSSHMPMRMPIARPHEHRQAAPRPWPPEHLRQHDVEQRAAPSRARPDRCR